MLIIVVTICLYAAFLDGRIYGYRGRIYDYRVRHGVRVMFGRLGAAHSMPTKGPYTAKYAANETHDPCKTAENDERR